MHDAHDADGFPDAERCSFRHSSHSGVRMKRSRWFVPLKSESASARASGRDDIETTADHRRHRMLRLYMMAILLVSMMMTMYIWQQTKMVEIKIRLQTSEKRIDSLETNNAVVRAEISKLQSIARIEKVARTELGMIPPQRMCYLPMSPLTLQR